jgi:hypothetical protein
MTKALKHECTAEPEHMRDLCGYWSGRDKECELPMGKMCRCARSVIVEDENQNPK